VVGELRLPASLAETREASDHRDREPAEPDALPHPGRADAVHPVVPIAGAHERQVVRAAGDATLECPLAVLKKRPGLGCEAEECVALTLLGSQRRAVEEGDALV
jgi:hypothetical protein